MPDHVAFVHRERTGAKSPKRNVDAPVSRLPVLPPACLQSTSCDPGAGAAVAAEGSAASAARVPNIRTMLM
jgi:hypothetical protein